jgi:hypothetical protein
MDALTEIGSSVTASNPVDGTSARHNGSGWCLQKCPPTVLRAARSNSVRISSDKVGYPAGPSVFGTYSIRA